MQVGKIGTGDVNNQPPKKDLFKMLVIFIRKW